MNSMSKFYPLAMALVGLDPDHDQEDHFQQGEQVSQLLKQQFNIDEAGFEALIERLEPLICVTRSKHNGTLQQGFAVAGMWLYTSNLEIQIEEIDDDPGIEFDNPENT